jgi:energy-coupling factor transporter ATP-binding protein EcfA2
VTIMFMFRSQKIMAQPSRNGNDCRQIVVPLPASVIVHRGSSDELLHAVREYLTLGFSVIPLRFNSKQPALDGWSEFQLRQPTTDEVQKWWSNGHQHGIAIVCGKVSNLVVLDIDDETKFGVALKAIGEVLPDTPIVRTRKGWHLYFRYPANRIVRRHDRLSDWGAELRGDGCYVVAPPSVVGGHRYHWAKRNGKRMALGEVPLAECPEWLLDAFGVPFVDGQSEQKTVQQSIQQVPQPTTQPTNGKGYTLSDEQKRALKSLLVPNWVEGQRHDLALGLAGLLAKSGIVQDEALALLREIANEANDNEWKDRERALKDTFDRLWEGKEVIGFKRLEEIVGDQTATLIANIVQPRTSQKPSPAPSNGHRANFQVMTAADLLTLPSEPIPPLIDGLVFKGTITVFIGETSAGKTTLFYHMASALAKGEPFLNRPIVKPYRVLFIDAETPIPLAQAKLGDLIDPQDEAAKRFYWLRLSGLSADDQQACDQLLDVVRQIQPDVVFVDPLNAVMLVEDFNDEAEARKQLQPWKRIADEFGCAVVLSAHPPKDRSRKGAARWRGSFARAEIVDIAFSIEGNFQSDILTLELVKDRTGCAIGKLTLRKVGGFEVVEGADEDAASRWIVNFIRKAHEVGKSEIARAEIISAAKEAGWNEKTIVNRLTALVQTGKLERPRRGFYRLPSQPDTPSPDDQSPEVPAPNPRDLGDLESPKVPNIPQGLSGHWDIEDAKDTEKVPKVPQPISGTLGHRDIGNAEKVPEILQAISGTSGTFGTFGTSGISGTSTLSQPTDEPTPEPSEPAYASLRDDELVDAETLIAELDATEPENSETDLSQTVKYVDTEQSLEQLCAELSEASNKPPDDTSLTSQQKPDRLACLCGGELRLFGKTYECLCCDSPRPATCRHCGKVLKRTSNGHAECIGCGISYAFDIARRLWLADDDVF